MVVQRSKIRPDRRQVLKAAAAGGALLLTGCASAVQQQQHASSKPKRGGTFNFGQQSDFNQANFLGQTSNNLGLDRALFNTLTRYNTKTLAPGPDLATSWSYSDGDTTLTMQLRRGVSFHSGDPFTAADVVYTVQTLKSALSTSQFKVTAGAVTDVSADSDTQVTFRLAHPVNNLFDMFEAMMILSSKTSGNPMVQGTPVVGTGPFMWKEYVPNNHLLLQRNPKYWKGGGLPYLDAVQLNVITDEQTLLLQLQSGQIEMALDLVPQQTIGLSSSKFPTVNSPVQAQAYYVGSNLKIPPLDNQTVRQAIAWSVNRERINKQVFRNEYRVTAGPWAPTSPAYAKSQDTHFGYNVQKAKQLLRQSGYQGQEISISPSPNLPECIAIAQILQNDMQAAGFKATIAQVDQATYSKQFNQGVVPGLFVAQHGFGGMHPATLFLGARPFNATSNASNFADPTYQNLAQQAWTVTGSSAPSVYKQITNLILDQAFTIGLVMGGDQATSTASFKGFSFDAFDDVIYDQAYLG